MNSQAAMKTGNLYLNEKQPWILIKDESKIPEVKEIIYNVLESTRIIGLLLLPILPDLSIKIDSQLGSINKKKGQGITPKRLWKRDN